MDQEYLKAFVKTPTYKELKAKIIEAQDLRAFAVAMRSNPLDHGEQANLLRLQGEMMGVRATFAMIETAGKDKEDGPGND